MNDLSAISRNVRKPTLGVMSPIHIITSDLTDRLLVIFYRVHGIIFWDLIAQHVTSNKQHRYMYDKRKTALKAPSSGTCKFNLQAYETNW